MGCTNSNLQGDSFVDIDAAASAARNPPTTTTNKTRRTKPSYSTQPGRRRQTTGGGDQPASTTALPTDADAGIVSIAASPSGIVSIAASPAGNWTADRARIRQDRMAYFRFKKQPSSASSTSTRRESLYGRQATSYVASRREEPGRRSLFP